MCPQHLKIPLPTYTRDSLIQSKHNSTKMEENKRFLHGTLEVTIFNVTPQSSSHCFNCLCAGGSKPEYVRIKIGNTRVAETRHEHNRVWNQGFRILCCHSMDKTITLSLRTAFSTLGKVQMLASSLLGEGHRTFSYSPLINKGRSNTRLKLQFSLRFCHVESDFDWGRGLRCGVFSGLGHGATFPQRSNCRVMLYQDAHHGHNFQPLISLRAGQSYRPRRLWEDVFKAINGAKSFIYIAGWSLNPKMVLVRDRQSEVPEARGVEIGEVLKRKAEEGVAVRIMIWDDKTSLHFFKNQGVMRTHDEEAFNYFKHTKVVCRLCPRLHHNFPTVFAHHQKTITVDANVELFDGRGEDGGSREIVSFIGGLDLCDGRYDTEEHSLFRTLNCESHAHDFYQINFAGAGLQKGGPREPWHDAHACVIGEAAGDVLANFEQRWAKQCDPSLLVPIKLKSTTAHHHGNWNVQVLRSIDHVSVTALPDNNCSAERSIHEAYVAAIRRADRFIYIENQYFIGGCHLWEQDQHRGCTNLIPVEIALKVASKIRAKERFAVYIVMPMWPEGVPESEPVQDILHWTRLTMAMMYKLIGDAIKESGARSHPTDYLNFFCLANREEKSSGEYIPPTSPPHSSHYWKAQKNRRFMIYVHSKLMIVDDEYIVIGSANVNQRSMDGERDTEIAIGCYQPEYVGEEGSRGGDIHKYRMSLWYEHTARMDEAFLEPQSLDCVSSLRQIGKEMWDVYSGETVVDMGGVHIVGYPLTVAEDGSIQDVAGGGGTFPDTTTLIKGRRSKLLPPVCTT